MIGAFRYSVVAAALVFTATGSALLAQTAAATAPTVRALTDRTAMWIGDRVTYTVEIVCPRGVGTSTYRLFEAMEAGRAPVLLADQWVAPEGPDWSSFLLRIPEKRVVDLPEILRGHEPEAVERGAKARSAWDEWFAPDVRFHTAVEACLSILAGRRRPERIAARLPTLEHYRVRTDRVLRLLRARVSGAPGPPSAS